MLMTGKRSYGDVNIGDFIETIRAPEADPDRSPMWHLIQCVNHSDRHVLDWMKRGHFETYYPHVKELRRVPRRFLSPAQRKSELTIMKPFEVPLFPRYVFVRFDMRRDEWREKFKFAGASGLVCGGGLPVVVPDDLVNKWKGLEDDGVIPGKTLAKLVFEVGDTVRVEEGPFLGFHATVAGREEIEVIDRQMASVTLEQIDSHTRIKLLIDIFGRQTPVTLEVTQVSRIDP